MNIAIMCHKKRQDLMIQFCSAYCGVLAKHTICATNIVGRIISEATGLTVHRYMSREHGGIEQIGQRIMYNEIDMVLFFDFPQDKDLEKEMRYIRRLCDVHNVPIATSLASAEMLIHGLSNGDLDWRTVAYPNRNSSSL